MERALLEMLSSHSSMALAVSDAEGQVTLTTPALERMVGRSGDTGAWDFESLPLHDATGERRLQPEEMPLARARRGEMVIDEICSLTRPDGWTVYLRCSANPLRRADDQIRGAIALVQDVTFEWVSMRKQAELRDRLVTTVSHELRTPLTKILGHAELLSETAGDGALAAPTVRSIEAIVRAAHQLGSLAEKLTHLANLEAVSSVDSSEIDVVPVLRTTVDDQRQRATSRGVALDLALPDDLTACVDEALLVRATQELLTNSLTYAPPGSCVAVGLQLLDGHFEICVRDQGPGIPIEERDRLTEPFERGEAPEGSVSSVGLGLAVVSAIAAAHGGTLTLDDNEPHGLVARMCFSRA